MSIGDYDLTCGPGFKTYSRTGFHLKPRARPCARTTLEVGQTTESVTVTAEISLFENESSTVAQNVTLTQLNNLPVLTVGGGNSGLPRSV